MRIVFISDTHNRLSQMSIPDGDVLIHCGDITEKGTKQEVFNELAVFNRFNHKHKLIIAGNHDHWFEDEPEAEREIADRFKNITYLEDSSTIINSNDKSYKVYGSPWTPNYCNWSFMPERNSVALKSLWSQIPDDTDILVTHGPPYGILDNPDNSIYGDINVGCELLKERLKDLSLKIHAFGHVHFSYGTETIDGTTFVNAASRLSRYSSFNEPIILEI